MKFWLYNHQGKGSAYIQALLGAEFELDAARPDFVLIDHDIGKNGQGLRSAVEKHLKAKIPVFLYPHAARPMVQWDGIYPVNEQINGSFVIAAGHVEVMRRYGYPLPTWPVGWTYCRIKSFRAGNVKNILFAPIHPNASGWLCEEDRQANAQAFEALLKLKGVAILVRYIRGLSAQGLWAQRGVRYLQARPDGSHHEIDWADLTVAHQTHAYLAIARGKPTIMLGDRMCPHSGNHPDNLRWAANWESYREYLAYPYDVADGNLAAQIGEASHSDAAIREWRERFIGQPFDGKAFVNQIRKVMHD
jgi:hypothetical protein